MISVTVVILNIYPQRVTNLKPATDKTNYSEEGTSDIVEPEADPLPLDGSNLFLCQAGHGLVLN